MHSVLSAPIARTVVSASVVKSLASTIRLSFLLFVLYGFVKTHVSPSILHRASNSFTLSHIYSPSLAAGAISFDPLCISQSWNSHFCLAGNAIREKMRSLGSLLDLCVSKTPPTQYRSLSGCGRRWLVSWEQLPLGLPHSLTLTL